MTTRKKPAPPAAAPSAADMSIAATERPTFPLTIEIEGQTVELRADGSAHGDAKALSAKMASLVGQPNQGSLLAWQLLVAIKSSAPAPRPRR